MVSENGLEILIHVGIDTVKLKGEPFEAIIEAGIEVKKGDILMNFDLNKIKEY